MRKTDKSLPPARNPAVSIVLTTYLRGLCLPWSRIDSRESVRWPIFWPAHERFGAGPGLLQRFSRAFFVGHSWGPLCSAFLSNWRDIDGCFRRAGTMRILDVVGRTFPSCVYWEYGQPLFERIALWQRHETQDHP